MKVLNKLIDYRYIIALIIFITSVSLELHGSSISNWGAFGVTETVDGRQVFPKTIDKSTLISNWFNLSPSDDGTIVGQPRMIRTDEWLVQTPFFLSQVATGSQLVNPAYGVSGQDMLLAYHAPIKSLSIIGKPFNWGFLFLGAAKGLSWYWSFKLIGFFLLAFEFSMILTRRNRFVSILGSLWITSIPSIQWWFMQHLGDIVFFTLASIVAIYYFFNSHAIWKKIGMATLLSSSLIGFVLVIYPAFQVVFAYLILAFFIIEFSKAFRRSQISSVDVIIMIATVLFTVAVIGFTLLQSQTALSETLHTVYPGQRISLGGEVGVDRIGDFILSFFLPFKIPSFANQVELSTAISFLPFVLILVPFLLKKQDIKQNPYPVFLFLYTILLLVYSFIQLPSILVKPFLFHYVTGGRVWQSISVIGVFLSIWFIDFIWSQKEIKTKRWLFVFGTVLISGLLVLNVLRNPIYTGYMGPKYMLLASILVGGAFIAVVYRQKLFSFFLLSALLAVSGLTINPVVKGLESIQDKKLSHAIQDIVQTDKDGVWISEGMLYNYPQMFGAKTLNSVRFYPDILLMEKLDPTGDNEQSWNRYAHTKITLQGEMTTMSTPHPDVLDIQLSVEQLSSLGVEYILTNRDLSQILPNVILHYGPDVDGNRIYHIQP